MHERNIFKTTKPDFVQLALEYKEFAPFVEKGASGKGYVDFKDPASLRALSTVLLKRYFNISIYIPLDRLIPTIPLRLNYIHWVEDLVKKGGGEEIFGVDVGCGASCVYPLLGWKMNKWKFIATEIDDESVKYAMENVEKNNAEGDIKVVKVTKEDAPISIALNSAQEKTFDFTLCNPPFYGENEESPLDRTGHRPPSASVCTASDPESFTEGGEVEFVKKMIEDSLSTKEKVRWYTSMLGKKSSIKPLTRCLKSHDIKGFDVTSFVQGKTRRWGIAWSFTEELEVKSSYEAKKKSKPFFLEPSESYLKTKGVKATAFAFQFGNKNKLLAELTSLLSSELGKLELNFDEPAQVLLQGKIGYEIVGKAFQKTWTHQRRKRREREKQASASQELLSPPNKKMMTQISDEEEMTSNSLMLKTSEAAVSEGHSKEEVRIELNEDKKVKKEILIKEVDTKGHLCADKCGPHRSDTEEPLFHFSITIGCISQFSFQTSDDRPVFSFLCLNGNRDVFYQLFTYFKNLFEGKQVQLKSL